MGGRKLVMTYSEEEPPMILTHSDYKPPEALADQAEPSTSPEFQMHLDTFLSYLIFWQDVLAHCKSVEVKETLLDHFQLLFLQQLLYAYHWYHFIDLWLISQSQISFAVGKLRH